MSNQMCKKRWYYDIIILENFMSNRTCKSIDVILLYYCWKKIILNQMCKTEYVYPSVQVDFMMWNFKIEQDGDVCNIQHPVGEIPKQTYLVSRSLAKSSFQFISLYIINKLQIFLTLNF